MSFIKLEVWGAKTIFLWHDNSHPIGTLSLEFGYRVIYDAASKPEAKAVYSEGQSLDLEACHINFHGKIL